jgi:hypothetical protein
MALNCTCPLGVLPNQVDLTCATDLDQIVRIAFQKPQATAPFTTAEPIGEVDSWTALLAASGDTKIVLSPAIANLVIPSSEAVYVGENSNESINGLGYYLGENNIRITAEIHSASQEVIDALSSLSCYSDVTLGASNLTAFLFMRRIKGVSKVVAKGSAVAGDYNGFEIFNFRVSSVGSEGYQTKSKYMISFDMQPDVWEAMELVATDFNPLALANVATT